MRKAKEESVCRERRVKMKEKVVSWRKVRNLPLHLTPASSKCVQSFVCSLTQSIRLASVPSHITSSSKIGPVPIPN